METPNKEEKPLAVETEKKPVEASPAEPSKEVEVSEQPKEDVKEEKVVEDQSDRAKSRQQELANRLKDSEVEKDNLREELKSYKVSKDAKDLEVFSRKGEKIDPPPEAELSYDQLDQYITQKADQLVNLRLSQKSQEDLRLRSFEKGVTSIESKFKELNPDSDEFDTTLSSTVTKLYRKASKDNPDVDVYDFVQSIMSIRDSGAEKAVSEIKKETVMKEATSAITPSTEKTATTTDAEKLEEGLKTGKISAKEAEKYLQ